MENHPGCFCPYIALTRESARNIMWPALEEQAMKLGIAAEFTESNLTVTHPNGARVQLFGADMKNFIRRLKGIKTPGAAIDEAQDFGPHLESLVDDVLTPTLTDYSDSWLAITGTPGPVPKGYFYDITKGRKYGYSYHAWTIEENPYIQGAQKFIEELKEKRQWDETHPTLRREWRNEWVLDTESLLIRYVQQCCDFQAIPPGKWTYVLGVDLGLRDADAIAVIAWNESTPNIYLIDEYTGKGNDITQLVEAIRHFSAKYDPVKIVVDEGALGKKIAEEIRRRHQIPIMPADKMRKMENVALLNDYMRLGKFKAKSTSQFVQDSYQVEIDWDKSRPDKIAIKPGFHSDIIDAVLYAFKESPAWTWREAPPKLITGSAAWAQAEVDRMEKEAEEYFNDQASLDSWN